MMIWKMQKFISILVYYNIDNQYYKLGITCSDYRQIKVNGKTRFYVKPCFAISIAD